MKLPVTGGYLSVGWVTKKRVGVGAGAAVSWTMESGTSVAVRAKAQVKGRRGSVGGQAGLKWNEEKGWGLTGQAFGRADKGVVKIDEKKNLKFGFPWAGLILSTDKSRWYNLGEEWADILGLRPADILEYTLDKERAEMLLRPTDPADVPDLTLWGRRERKK
jgi:hypothetical protein